LSPDPIEAAGAAVGSQTHSWVVTAGVGILLGALTIMLLARTLFGEIMGAMGGFGGFLGNMGVSLPLGPFFGYGLLACLISFAVWACCIKGVYAISKVNAPFAMVLNLTASSLLPAALAGVAAILFSFFYPTGSILLVFVGLVANVIMLYVGLNQSAQFQKSPFWLFLIAYIVCLIIMAFVTQKLVEMTLEAVGKAMESRLDSFNPFGGMNPFDIGW